MLDDSDNGAIQAIAALAEMCQRSAELDVLREIAALTERPRRYPPIVAHVEDDPYELLLERLRAVQRDRRLLDRMVTHAILRDVFFELGARTASWRAA